MSNSHRKNPIFPVTLARSDKDTKGKAHKQERRALKTKLVLGERFKISDVPGGKSFGDPWNSNKDGKRYWGDATKKDLSK